MKRFFLLLMVLCLLLPCMPALAQSHDFSGAFQVTYPDGWVLDTTFGTEGNTEEFQVLGAFETFASTIEISISDDRAYYQDYTVPTKMNSDYYGYLAELMSLLEQAEDTVSCEYVKGISNKDGNVMFLVFYVDDGEGGYYYADTMLGGCTLLFYAYSNQTLLPTGARQLAELETLLKNMVFANELFN